MKPVPKNQPMGFLSDIHGNLRALDAAVNELTRRGVTTFYVAGDLLLGGDDPVGVFKRLSQLNATCVAGVSDTALARVDPDSLSPSTEQEKERARQFAETHHAIGELARMFLNRLPETHRIPMIDGSEILLVHGSPADPSTQMGHDLEDEELNALIADDPADVIICGASHVPFTREIGEVRVVNVGSVGAAPEGRFAHYTVVTPRMEGMIIEQTCVEY